MFRVSLHVTFEEEGKGRKGEERRGGEELSPCVGMALKWLIRPWRFINIICMYHVCMYIPIVTELQCPATSSSLIIVVIIISPLEFNASLIIWSIWLSHVLLYG